MNTTLINHPRLKLSVHTGTEGPHYDPWAYEEYELKCPNGELLIHAGLGEYIVIGGKKNRNSPASVCTAPRQGLDPKNFKAMVNAFCEEFAGFTLTQMLRIAGKRKVRCPKGGYHDVEWSSGYPGEELAYCHKCDRIVDSTFNESAVM